MVGRKFWLRIGLASFGALALYQLFSGPGGLFNLLRLHEAKKDKALILDSLETERVSLEREKGLLKTDTAFIEKTAREKLGMAMPGEKVYRYMGAQPKTEDKD
jgi:cell division protein FtsB